MFFLALVCLLSFYGFALLFTNLSEIQVNPKRVLELLLLLLLLLLISCFELFDVSFIL